MVPRLFKNSSGLHFRSREKWYRTRNKAISMNQVHNKCLILIVSNLGRVYSEEANFGPSLKSFTNDVKSVGFEIETLCI